MHISKINNERELGYHIDQLIRTIWMAKATDKQMEGYFHMHSMYCLEDDCELREDLTRLKAQDESSLHNSKEQKRGARSYMMQEEGTFNLLSHEPAKNNFEKGKEAKIIRFVD